PPAHTIARSAAYAPATPPATPAFLTGRTDATAVSAIPIAVDERLLALGAKQFAISCAPCHGAGGFGGGPVAPNILPHRPPSLRTAPVATLPPGMLFSVITQGFGQMPPYGWQMTPEMRWAVVAYVRALTAQPMTAESRADSAQADDIRRVDSLRASGASLEQIAKQPERE